MNFLQKTLWIFVFMILISLIYIAYLGYAELKKANANFESAGCDAYITRPNYSGIPYIPQFNDSNFSGTGID